MKKLLLSLGIIGILSGITTFASASTTNTNCKDVEFSNGVTACVNIEKVSTDRRRLITSTSNGSTANLYCGLMTPSLNGSNYQSQIVYPPLCNGEFYYDGKTVGRIKLWIKYAIPSYPYWLMPTSRDNKPNNNSERTFPQWVYDFGNEGRTDDNINNNNNNNSNGDLDNFYLTTNDSTPSTYQYVNLTVQARDNDNYTLTDYNDTIKFKVYYRSSSSSSWVQTTSSTYYTMSSSYTNGYDFTSSNNGTKTFTNFIKFNRNNYEYKVSVYDENDTSIYKEITFNVGSSNNNNSNGDLDNFLVTADDTTPSTSQYIDLTVKARDSSNYTITDYNDTINFKVYYRVSNSSTWIQTTSSTYYTMSSSYTNGYDFTSSNNGTKTFTNFIKFNRNNYEYKVRVYDENDTSIYKEITFNVGSSSSTSNGDLDNFSVAADDSSPSTYQYVDLSITARDSNNYTVTDYNDTVKFKVYYGHANTSSWTQTTSSSYYTMASNYNTYGYSFSSYDDGIANLNNFIQFKNSSYDYKVRVYDVNDSSVYKETIFYVNDNSSSNVDGFTSSELNTVESIYNARDNMISNLESDYPTLRNSSRRQTMSDDFKIAMQEIINDDNNKTYDTFAEFYNAWLDWYRYTIATR